MKRHRHVRHRRARLSAIALLSAMALSALGCMSTPSPLAPALSGSIGVPHNGVLTESRELPQTGAGYVRFRQRAEVYHGLPRLVSAIERAAASVEAEYPGGAPLVVGDLSAQRGGKIPRHNSHRSGRDVDLLFYITTPTGIPIQNPGFLPLGADGFVELPGGSYGVLDVERQWHLLRTLLLDPEADVQFMFMSRELEARLVQYALAKETDLDLIWHAQTVMLQPGDSLPHADHVHLRIACRPEESVTGCSGGGPHWPWLTPFPHLTQDTTALLEEIGRDDPFELAPLPPELDTPEAPSDAARFAAAFSVGERAR